MREKCRVDVALWGGAVPGNASQFAAMLDEGVVGFKCFLVDSGVPEFGHLDARGLDEAMAALRKTTVMASTVNDDAGCVVIVTESLDTSVFDVERGRTRFRVRQYIQAAQDHAPIVARDRRAPQMQWRRT
jgi:allantoinase